MYMCVYIVYTGIVVCYLYIYVWANIHFILDHLRDLRRLYDQG